MLHSPHPGRRAGGRTAIAAVFLLLQGAGTAATTTAPPPGTNIWVVPEDIEVEAKANTAVGEYCKGRGFRGEVDRESGKEALVSGAGKDNVILEILKDATSNEDLAIKAQEKITPGWIIEKAGPIVMAFIVAAVWFGCCWSACPFCKCCRHCTQKRDTHWILKVLLFIFALLLIFGIIFCSTFAMAGYDQSIQGFNNMACTSAKLLNASLGGQQAEPAFIGMTPLLTTFWTLEQSLNDGSPMLKDIDALLDSTSSISQSIKIASTMLGVLQDVLGPSLPAGIQENRHSCEFCTILGPVLGTTVEILESSVGSALAQARTEVSKQLSAEKRAELQSNLRTSTGPLLQVKELIRNTFSFFVDSDKFMQVRDILDGQIKILSIIIIIFAVLLSACMLTSVVSFGLRERHLQRGSSGVRPYNPLVHRCACCAWCCGFLYAILTFFFGGLLMGVGVPMSSMCLIMDDMSAPLLLDIGPAVGLNLTGDEGVMIGTIIDKCFVLANRSANPALLDLIYTRDSLLGPPVTMRQQIVDNVKSQISSKFDDISGKMSTGGGSGSSLANAPEVQSLASMLGGNPIDLMILPADLDAFKSDADYQAMFTGDVRDSSLSLSGAFVSSVQCLSGTVGPGVGDLSNKTIAGVSEFTTRLRNFGMGGDCASPKVVCNGLPGSSPGRDACDAGNRFAELKRKIRALTFNCDVFKDPTDGVSDCDPLNMSSVLGTRMWIGGCLFADGTMARKPKTCTLPEFVTYVENYGKRLLLAMQRIDDTVAQVGSEINDGLRTLVDTNIVDPIDRVANGVTCGFLGLAYTEMVNGLCYQGVVGFQMIGKNYLADAVLTLFITLFMYILWRRTIDNYNTLAKGDVQVSSG